MEYDVLQKIVNRKDNPIVAGWYWYKHWSVSYKCTKLSSINLILFQHNCKLTHEIFCVKKTLPNIPKRIVYGDNIIFKRLYRNSTYCGALLSECGVIIVSSSSSSSSSGGGGGLIGWDLNILNTPHLKNNTQIIFFQQNITKLHRNTDYISNFKTRHW